ncbi:sigma-70 family RNA polymerase sigma factor [Halobacillus salinus]|uniref:Sigma-70 family RNA polymerase sigma factor n=1 Tax=Halobacillus salinus TaxID=192814 RepID=A0A4Z0GWG5_9BACI|nr:sigma-70 family RNA polymerase sigma factor [Halobacillus salinus]TGB01310.1 sigma-70 family RNA polymerase sigma factor [Halobacillus salinus]
MDEVVRHFFDKFPDLKGNQAVETFIRMPEHREVIEEYLRNPIENNRLALDQTFKAYYFDVRFTSYVSTSLYFQSVNFDKRARRFAGRNALTLDQPIGDGEGTTFKDQIADPNGEYFLKEDNLEACVEDEKLIKALATLTDRQRRILNLAYFKQWSDTAIANEFDVTQQSISKSHRTALMKLKNEMTKGE